MRIDNLVSNSLDSELKYVDIENTSQHSEKQKTEDMLKEKIKFNSKSIDTLLYSNQLILIGIYGVICIASLFFGDFLSIINPIIMTFLIILLSSNPILIQNNKYLDVGAWNLSSSLGIIVKSFNLFDLSKRYEDLTEIFTKMFIFSLLITGHPGFNSIFILITSGLIVSYIFCLTHKDIDPIKKSGEDIRSKELIYIVISTIIFVISFKGSVANTTVFTVVTLLKYFHNSIKEYEFKTFNK